MLKKFGITCVFFGLLISGPNESFGEESKPAGPADMMIEAIANGEPSDALAVLESPSIPLSGEDIRRILGELHRRKLGIAWIPFMQGFIERYPKEARLRLALARIYRRSGAIEPALRYAGEAVEHASDDLVLLYQAAALAQISGRSEKAKEWLALLFSKEKNDPDALFLMARIDAEENELERAESLLRQAAGINPKHYLARFELGRLKNRTGEYPEAELQLREAVRLYPFFREAYNALLISLARQQKKKEVENIKAVADQLAHWNAQKEERLRFSFFNPGKTGTQDGYELAAELCVVKREDLAKTFLEKIVESGQPGEPFLFLLSQLRYKDGDYQGCLEMLGRLKQPGVIESEAYANFKAWSLYRIGRIEECRSFLAEALKKHSGSKQLQSLAKLFQSREIKDVEKSNPDTMKSDGKFQFTDVAEKAGLYSFKHVQGNPDKRWIIDAMGSGVAVGDYDNDGDDDIYFVNARSNVFDPDPKNRNTLFQNEGGRFVDATEKAGVGEMGYGMCAAFGDIDNDGDLDLFVGNYQDNTLYENRGDGTFAEITKKAGMTDSGYAACAAFGDVDGDGWLDLFVGNYIEFDPKKQGDMRDRYHGLNVFAGPLAFQHQNDLLYINQRDGTFKEMAKKAGINVSNGRAMGCVFFDLDNDGDLDLYVSNDSTYNHVLLNRGNGTFEDISFLSGGAFNENGVAGGSMGVCVGDVNNDGLLDIYVTAYEQMPDSLYFNKGMRIFSDITRSSGLVKPTQWLITWGSGFCDFNANGLLDLYTSNGHIYPQIDSLGVGRSYHQSVSFYQNTGKRFVEANNSIQPNHFLPISGRGTALLDYDNDGDMDVLVNCVDSTPVLLENHTPQGHWLKVKLKGTSAQTFGVRVVARKGEKQWTRFADGGSGYLSQNSQTLHFGFGDTDVLDDIAVHWLHKEKTVIENVSVDRLLIIPQ